MFLALAPIYLVYLPKAIKVLSRDTTPKAPTQIDGEEADNAWSLVEWLEREATSNVDRIGTEPIARRIAGRIQVLPKAVGLVGPFGSGKSTIVTWVDQLLTTGNGIRRFIVCKTSAWEFDHSGLAIESLLEKALAEVRTHVDTFDIESLPESYKQTFALGTDWARGIFDLLLGKRDPIEQFNRLDELLETSQLVVVFIIEDLDRTDTDTYQVAELFGFLDRLRRLEHITFLLTGGEANQGLIDFQKLCDYIESVPPVLPESIYRLVNEFRSLCLQGMHPHPSPPSRHQNPWDPASEVFDKRTEGYTFTEAIANLIVTPRTLRLVLQRTDQAWGRLKGEICFDDLLALNVLRYGAPEAFRFLVRYYDRLNIPSQGDGDWGQTTVEAVRKSLKSRWSELIESTIWDPNAVLRLYVFLLPKTEYWIGDKERTFNEQEFFQGVRFERYWKRALAEDLRTEEISDVKVVNENDAWIASKGIDNSLVHSLCELQSFGVSWYDLCRSRYFDKPGLAKLLADQVITYAISENGASTTLDTTGVYAALKTLRDSIYQEEPDVWLQSIMEKTIVESIELTNGLWKYFEGDFCHEMQKPLVRASIRINTLNALRAHLENDGDLGELLTEDRQGSLGGFLWHIVLDGNSREPQPTPSNKGIEWLVDAIIAGIEAGNPSIVPNCLDLFWRYDTTPAGPDLEWIQHLLGDNRYRYGNALAGSVRNLSHGQTERTQQIVRATLAPVNDPGVA
jgi:hypothetical protein